MLQFKSAPKITTDRLLIRIVSEEDAKDFYEFCSDPLVCEYLTFNPYKSLFHTKTIINNMINAYIHGTDVNFSVVLKDTLKVIGSVSLNFKSKENFTEIGYLFNRSYWNKGYAYEAVEAVIKVAFEYYNVEFVVANYINENLLSGKLLKKLNFIEYVGSQNKFIKNNHYYDLVSVILHKN